jgi:hypothetical protein
MIHTITLALAAALKAKGVPFTCEYGPNPVPSSVGATRIYMMRDYGADEALQPPRGRFDASRMFAVRGVPAVVRIFAKSTAGGATRADHEALADSIADQVQTELHKAIRALKTIYAFTRAGLVEDETTDGWAGAVYEIRLTVDRGVRDALWVPDTGATMTMTKTTTVNALAPTGPGEHSGLPAATTRIDP